MTAAAAIDILLVEDNPQDAELALRSLRRAQIANPVHVASDGAEALDFLLGAGVDAGAARERPPKVVFLDLKLPKVSGLEVLKRIKEDARTRSIPVVVLTSSREEPDVRAAYLLGANSYVVKPIDFEQFAGAVHQMGLYWLLLNEPPR